jgi:hypothetical protein
MHADIYEILVFRRGENLVCVIGDYYDMHEGEPGRTCVLFKEHAS